MEVGLIDRLIAAESLTPEDARRDCGLDAVGTQMLLEILIATGVVRGSPRGAVSLTEAFRAALRYRDLLEAKLDFTNLVIRDMSDYFTDLIADPSSFQSRARVFDLFNYQRAIDPSAENRRHTRSWMRLTTALTRYEGPVALSLHDFGRHRRMLDVGGNSGEFARWACRRNPQLVATVVDLPLVCEAGRQYIARTPEAGRIDFLDVSTLGGRLPTGFDLITFKSMLHDWPDAHVLEFLSAAAEALEPRGTVLIFERAASPVGPPVPSYADLPMLMFYRSYRHPSSYRKWLAAEKFWDIEVREVVLDRPFLFITAVKPDTRGADADGG